MHQSQELMSRSSVHSFLTDAFFSRNFTWLKWGLWHSHAKTSEILQTINDKRRKQALVWRSASGKHDLQAIKKTQTKEVMALTPEWILKQRDSWREVFFLKNTRKIKQQTCFDLNGMFLLHFLWKVFELLSCLACSYSPSLLIAHVLHLCSCLHLSVVLLLLVFVWFSLWILAACCLSGYLCFICFLSEERFCMLDSAAFTGSTGIIWSCNLKVL